ncbi:hypothetical protein OKW96_12025 [Sphingobacterium sp. KU25419]|nr:hypothetical protein OKW96_12025 [Sphingobacterium sp. KU25419]
MKNNKIIILLAILLLLMQTGCKKDFLDQRPDLSKVIPRTLADCQALLDDYNRMNAGYSDHGEAAADNYFLPMRYIIVCKMSMIHLKINAITVGIHKENM